MKLKLLALITAINVVTLQANHTKKHTHQKNGYVRKTSDCLKNTSSKKVAKNAAILGVALPFVTLYPYIFYQGFGRELLATGFAGNAMLAGLSSTIFAATLSALALTTKGGNSIVRKLIGIDKPTLKEEPIKNEQVIPNKKPKGYIRKASDYIHQATYDEFIGLSLMNAGYKAATGGLKQYHKTRLLVKNSPDDCPKLAAPLDALTTFAAKGTAAFLATALYLTIIKYTNVLGRKLTGIKDEASEKEDQIV